MPTEPSKKPRWDDTNETDRLLNVIACGWITRSNKLSAIGHRIVRSAWKDISPAAKNILIKKGFSPE